MSKKAPRKPAAFRIEEVEVFTPPAPPAVAEPESLPVARGRTLPDLGRGLRWGSILIGALGGLIGLLVLSGVTVWSLARDSAARPKLTDRDTIVLADFDNKTGDAVFDDTLKTGLTVALNQSPLLNVLSERKVTETLKLMTLPSSTKLTQDVARELCIRAGSKAYVAGSIANLGNEYVLGLKTVNCQSGETLAQEQVTANGKEKVLNALGDAAAKLRQVHGRESCAPRQALASYFTAGPRWACRNAIRRSAREAARRAPDSSSSRRWPAR